VHGMAVAAVFVRPRSHESLRADAVVSRRDRSQARLTGSTAKETVPEGRSRRTGIMMR